MTRWGGKEDLTKWKPKGYENWLMVHELCEKVNRSRDSIIRAERANLIPSPIRFKMGEINYRLYSPEDVVKCQEHFANTRPGRKTKEVANGNNRTAA